MKVKKVATIILLSKAGHWRWLGRVINTSPGAYIYSLADQKTNQPADKAPPLSLPSIPCKWNRKCWDMRFFFPPPSLWGVRRNPSPTALALAARTSNGDRLTEELRAPSCMRRSTDMGWTFLFSSSPSLLPSPLLSRCRVCIVGSIQQFVMYNAAPSDMAGNPSNAQTHRRTDAQTHKRTNADIRSVPSHSGSPIRSRSPRAAHTSPQRPTRQPGRS